MSSRGQMINDMPMELIPSLALGEAGYESRVALRAQHIIKNQSNKMQRCRIWLDDLTKIYSLLYACVVEANMTLAGELLDNCDMSERPPIAGGQCLVGSMDGHQAYQIVLNSLFECERTEADKLYYKTALEVQEKYHLPDHCAFTMYDKKAYAFINYIKPHLAQAYSTADAAFFLIAMMPKVLKQSGRALRERL